MRLLRHMCNSWRSTGHLPGKNQVPSLDIGIQPYLSAKYLNVNKSNRFHRFLKMLGSGLLRSMTWQHNYPRKSTRPWHAINLPLILYYYPIVTTIYHLVATPTQLSLQFIAKETLHIFSSFEFLDQPRNYVISW